MTQEQLDKLPEFQKRVIEEKKELDEKIMKLESFIKGDLFKKLNVLDSSLLELQYLAMVQYSQILSKRIGIFISK